MTQTILKESLTTDLLNGLNLAEISKKYNLPYYKIAYLIKKYDLPYSYPTRKKMTDRKRPRKFILIDQKLEDRDWLYKEHKIDKKSGHQIAKELGIGATLVNRWLRKHNIESNGKGFEVISKESLKIYAEDKRKHISHETLNKTANKQWLEDEHITKRKSCRTIAKELGDVSTNFIVTKLKEHNIAARRNNISSYEIEIKDFLKKYEDITLNLNDRNIISPKEIDIFLPVYNLGIEYHGLYWHSYNQKETQEEIKKHQTKAKICLGNGINLLQIFEYEWKNERTKEIWKSIILNKIQKSKIIFARKCSISTVTGKQTKEFLDENHLQGNCQSKIRLGLYYENELVSLMTFGTSRFEKKEKTWELIRFANKKGIRVIGGASRLLKNFERTYSPRKIKTYADLRHSDGNLYMKLGFQQIDISKPNYWYYRENKILSRYQAQKHKIPSIISNYNPNKTEAENMFGEGFRRFWDAGNLVFQKVYT